LWKVRARPFLALSLLAVSTLAAGSTLDGKPAVRASLEGDAFVAAQAPAPRRIRYSLDDAENGMIGNASGNAAFPADVDHSLVVPRLPPRAFRLSLDAQDAPAFSGRLIRLSLDEGHTLYGRLGESTILGRRLRKTLD
jgi:hypothetical protein